MSNTLQGGFRFRRMANGAKLPPVEVGFVATSYGTALYKGDPVKRLNDGSLALLAEGDTDCLGVMLGVKQYWDGTVLRSGNYLPATTVWGTNQARQSQIFYTPVIGAVFEVDADDASTAATEAAYQALIGENVDAQAAAGSYAVNTSTGISGYTVDISTHTTSTANCRIVGTSPRLDNDYTALGAKLLVQFNETSMPPSTTSGI